ncbi:MULTISPECIES: hypothetical protein [Anaerotruncus]|jgi:hypothetical protein|uniref:hypothetical protein n=1 Tax=Anaerotruncus TaxID=244127 RepID=UPI002089EEDB|nr:hypothetical protein [Anaerotruncus massiliensis (ex Togo et al. 2019)]GKH45735.1 hypothetical protein CE91St45_02970 [Oscillospiraceae bacterium]
MADKVTRFTDNEVVTTAVFNQRVDETNAAFAVVDEAIDGLSGTGGEIPAIREKDVQQDARLGTLETAAAAAERDIAANDARDDVQDTQIAELGATLGQHGTDITGLKTDVESHSQQIAAHVADTTVHITGAERTAWNGKATTSTLPATLTAAGWVGETAPFTQEVAVAGITGIMNPLTDIILSEETDTAIAELEAWGMVSSITTGDGKITARCLEDKPEVDLNLQMKAVQ